MGESIIHLQSEQVQIEATAVVFSRIRLTFFLFLSRINHLPVIHNVFLSLFWFIYNRCIHVPGTFGSRRVGNVSYFCLAAQTLCLVEFLVSQKFKGYALSGHWNVQLRRLEGKTNRVDHVNKALLFYPRLLFVTNLFSEVMLVSKWEVMIQYLHSELFGNLETRCSTQFSESVQTVHVDLSINSDSVFYLRCRTVHRSLWLLFVY